MNTGQLPDKNDILKSRARIREKVHRTPVLTCGAIDRITGCELFFKCENFQKVGAFKARGACNAAFSLSEEQRIKGIATHSSGNHAQALSYAAGLLGIRAFVIMPDNAPAVKVNAVRMYGGEVIFCEPTLQARERELNRVVEETGAYFIHPYNDYDVIAGQASAACELFEEVPALDYIITPVGGGGLLSGTSLARNYFSPVTRVIAAEPSGANDAWLSLQQGKLIPPVKPSSIADGLLTALGSLTFPIIRENVEKIIVVSDEEIITAMRLIWERMKIIVEPSASVTLAAVMKEKENFRDLKIGILLSGGNIDIGRLPF